MGRIRSQKCKKQDCTVDGTLQHELLYCSKNDGVGHKLVACLKHYLPALQPDDVLRLDHGDTEDELPLPLALLTAIKLSHIWKARESGKAVQGYKVRAELEQYITLLRTSRLASSMDKLFNMVSLMLQ